MNDNKKDLIGMLLWKVPEMNMKFAVEILAQLDTKEKQEVMLNVLKNYEQALPKMTLDDVAKMGFSVLSANFKQKNKEV